MYWTSEGRSEIIKTDVFRKIETRSAIPERSVSICELTSGWYSELFDSSEDEIRGRMNGSFCRCAADPNIADEIAPALKTYFSEMRRRGTSAWRRGEPVQPD